MEKFLVLLDDRVSSSNFIDSSTSIACVWKALELELNGLNAGNPEQLKDCLEFLDKFLPRHYRFYESIFTTEHPKQIIAPSSTSIAILNFIQRNQLIITDLPFSILLDICSIYSIDNHDVVSEIMNGQVVRRREFMISNLEEFVDILTEKLQLFQRRCEKTSSASDSPIFYQFDGFETILDGLWTLHSLLMVCDDFAPILISHPDCFISLSSCYSSVFQVPDKHSNMLETHTKECFIKYLSITVAFETFERTLYDTKCNDDTISNFVSLILELLNVPAEGQDCLHDAHFLADLEIVYGLTEHLRKNSTKFDEYQLQYLMDSMKHITSSTIISHLLPRHHNHNTPPRTGGIITNNNIEETLDLEHYNAFVEKTALISQVKDLFPQLGDGFIDSLLIHFDNNVEKVITCLCEDSIPTNIAIMDRNAERIPLSHNSVPSKVVHVSGAKKEVQPKPESFIIHDFDLLENRRNIYDGDEFDIFRNDVDTSKVIFGKKQSGNALNDKHEISELKERIIQFSIYDDEYDDTLEELRAAVPIGDEIVDDGDLSRSEAISEDSVSASQNILIDYYNVDPSIFDKSGDARKSQVRNRLKGMTKMSDEQLEGWKIMLEKNPNKQRILDEHQRSVLMSNRRDFSNESSGGKTQRQESDQGSRGRGNGRGRGVQGKTHNRKNLHLKKTVKPSEF